MNANFVIYSYIWGYEGMMYDIENEKQSVRFFVVVSQKLPIKYALNK